MLNLSFLGKEIYQMIRLKLEVLVIEFSYFYYTMPIVKKIIFSINILLKEKKILPVSVLDEFNPKL